MKKICYLELRVNKLFDSTVTENLVCKVFVRHLAKISEIAATYL